MTQIEYARRKKTTKEVKDISRRENIPSEIIRNRIKSGKIVIPHNKKRRILKPCGIGLGLTTKVNANIGTSTYHPKIKNELKKLEIAIKYGADTVMDLSIGGDLKKIRRHIIRHSIIPVGTVPIYQAALDAERRYKSFLKMKVNDIFEILEEQAADGVDFFTIHAGVTLRNLNALLEGKRRIAGIVSRGGAILGCWMRKHNRENPLFEYFDRVLEIAHQYDITLSLGDGLRPGSVFDANDKAQMLELSTLGKLAVRAKKASVQVMIEGPGHVQLDKIKKNVFSEKKICNGAPFYVLGPLVTDVACGYDHISSAIGGAIAASYGADFLCFVTPSEHLRLPSANDVKEGTIASRIAAHSGDLVKGLTCALRWDKDMSIARSRRDWQRQIKLSLDREKSVLYYGKRGKLPRKDVCRMCGSYCAIKLNDLSYKKTNRN